MPLRHYSTVRSSPRERPDISVLLSYGLVDKPFELNFLQAIPSGVSIGAFQYVDPVIDFYMQERWPKCLRGVGTVHIPDNEPLTNTLIQRLLPYVRLSAWHLIAHETHLGTPDQVARNVGYRRQFLSRQRFDIRGNRQPSLSESYVPTQVADLVGPGVVSLPNESDLANQFAWSQIIPFPGRTSIASDHPRLVERVREVKRHYNSYGELRDATRHLHAGEVKACVRAAASAVDAILRYYCTQWNVQFPSGRLPFDNKIEAVLQRSGQPSYRAADPKNLERLLYLYRARNSMHEGDCYYKTAAGTVVNVQYQGQCAEFIESVQAFVIWIDALS